MDGARLGLAAVFTALLVLAAVVIVSARDASRDELLREFASGGNSTASFAHAALKDSADETAEAATQALGTGAVTARDLDELEELFEGVPIAVLDAGGRRIGSRPAGFRPDTRAGFVRAALSGRAVFSDLQPGPDGTHVVLSAIPVERPTGRLVIVEKVGDVEEFDGILGGVLRNATTSGGQAYITDGRDRIISSTAQPVGRRVANPELVQAADRLVRGIAPYRDRRAGPSHLAVAPIGTSDWRVVLAASDLDLFAPIDGTSRWLPWALVAGLGLAAMLAVGLLEIVRRRSQQLNVALEAKTQVLAALSHELRTPLNAMIGYASLFEDPRVPEAERREAAAHVVQAGLHLDALLSGLLDEALTDQGRAVLHVEQCAIGELVQSAVSAITAIASQRQMHVELSIASDLPTHVNVDPVRVRQVLFNYLSNAVKYAPAGTGISLRVLRAGARGIRFEVRDQGPGIPADATRRIFESYVRLDNPGTKGVGLGLAVTKRIATLHGGEVGVESTPGAGATFWFELPDVIVPEAPERPAAPTVA